MQSMSVVSSTELDHCNTSTRFRKVSYKNAETSQMILHNVNIRVYVIPEFSNSVKQKTKKCPR